VATVAEMRCENDQVRAELGQLSKQAASSAVQFDRLVAVNAELIAQVARLNDRVSELLAVARRRQRPLTPSPTPGPPPPLDAPAARAFADRPLPPPAPEKPKPAPKPRRPMGRKALPPHLEAERHDLRTDACAQCGGHALDAADVVKEHQRRRVARRTTCRCRDCGQRTTPRSLPAPYERSKVTSD
jgi:hypothetical protein